MESKNQKKVSRELVELEVLDFGMTERPVYKDGEKVGTETMTQVLFLGEQSVKFLGVRRESFVEKTCWSEIPLKQKGRQLFYAKISKIDGQTYYTLQGIYEK
jgi:hypothetical protein